MTTLETTRSHGLSQVSGTGYQRQQSDFCPLSRSEDPLLPTIGNPVNFDNVVQPMALGHIPRRLAEQNPLFPAGYELPLAGVLSP